MTENNVPKVYAAIHNVLKALQVEKGGMLPGNMGGKAYMTAEDISNEVKRLLVQNNVVLEANEDVVQVEAPDFGDKKMRFMITVKGTYRLIHVEDGSYITISGVGQGMGVGVATAAAVASTFAQKSALLRTFLISESGVEAEGHTEQAPPKQSQAQQTAAKAAPAAPKKASGKANQDAQKRIADKIGSGEYDKDRVTKLNATLAEELGKPKGEVMVELEQRLEAGETV